MSYSKCLVSPYLSSRGTKRFGGTVSTGPASAGKVLIPPNGGSQFFVFGFLLEVLAGDPTAVIPDSPRLSVDLLSHGAVSVPLMLCPVPEFPGEKRSGSCAVQCSLRVSRLGISPQSERAGALSGAGCVAELGVNVLIYCWGTEWPYPSLRRSKEPPLCLSVVLSLGDSSGYPVRAVRRGLPEPSLPRDGINPNFEWAAPVGQFSPALCKADGYP